MAEQWLHVTVQAINHTLPDPTVDQAARQRLIPRLEQVFSTTPAFTVQIGSVLTYFSGAVANAHYDEDAYNGMVERVRGEISEVCGPLSISHDSRPVHMALAYGRGKPGGDAAQRLLRRRVRPSQAPMTIDMIYLVEVEQDPLRPWYRWTEVKAFPLAAPAHQTDGATTGTA